MQNKLHDGCDALAIAADRTNSYSLPPHRPLRNEIRWVNTIHQTRGKEVARQSRGDRSASDSDPHMRATVFGVKDKILHWETVERIFLVGQVLSLYGEVFHSLLDSISDETTHGNRHPTSEKIFHVLIRCSHRCRHLHVIESAAEP
jgi:hypothetical protein